MAGQRMKGGGVGRGDHFGKNSEGEGSWYGKTVIVLVHE